MPRLMKATEISTLIKEINTATKDKLLNQDYDLSLLSVEDISEIAPESILNLTPKTLLSIKKRALGQFNVEELKYLFDKHYNYQIIDEINIKGRKLEINKFAVRIHLGKALGISYYQRINGSKGETEELSIKTDLISSHKLSEIFGVDKRSLVKLAKDGRLKLNPYVSINTGYLYEYNSVIKLLEDCYFKANDRINVNLGCIPELFNKDYLAERLGLAPKYVIKLVRLGKINCFKIDSKIFRFSKEDVIAYVNKQKKA